MKCASSLLAIGMASLAVSGCDRKPALPSTATDATSEATAESSVVVPTASEIAGQLAAGNFAEAARGADEAIKISPKNAELRLLLARANARLQNVGSAVDALQASFTAGFHDPIGALDNPDFDGIRANPVFTAFARKFERRRPGAAIRFRPRAASSITAGDVSIIEGRDGHSRIRAGDIDLKD